MTQHTLGPWRERQATGTCDRHILGPDGPIAIVPYKWGTPESRTAHAQLIISAPNLLAALEETEAQIDDVGRNATPPDAYAEIPWECVDKIRAAIAKAKGQS